MSDRLRYFEKAQHWATDTRIRESRLLRVAWIVAGVAVAVALFEAVALALLTPLKTVQPITLLVDRQTGYVQALDPLQPRKISADAALTDSFLAQYVIAREGFDRATVAQDYRRVALWSVGPARAQYLALMPSSNPSSPLQRYPSGIVVAARVKSVSRLSEGTTLVRFETQLQDRSGNSEAVRPWVSVVRFRYSDGPMAFADRLVNPLGFQVTGYRRDPEAPTPDPMQERPSALSGPTSPAARYMRPQAARTELSRPKEPVAYRGIAPSHIPLGSPLTPPGSGLSDVHASQLR